MKLVLDRAAGLGGGLISGFLWTGGVVMMFVGALRVGPRRPVGLYDISYQLFQLAIRGFAMATLMSIFVGMTLAWQFGDALMDFGAKMAIGNTTSLGLVRELVPAVLAITVGARMSAGMAAELGAMKVTEQIDAIAALGADPVKKLVWPRIVAATLGLPLLVVWGNAVAMVGGLVIAEAVFDVPGNYFYKSYIDELAPLDYLMSLTKGLVFGGLVGTIGCYHGFNTGFGTEAVGRATTLTVVATAICVIVVDFLLTMLFLPVGAG